MRASRAWWILLVTLASAGACSNSNPPCAAPGSGTFTVTLAYARTIPVSIYCGQGPQPASDGGAGNRLAPSAPARKRSQYAS